MKNLILFPSDNTFAYLQNHILEYIKDHKIENPIFAYYDFDNANVCETGFQEYNVGLRLNVALEFIKKYSETQKIKVYLFNPDVSNRKDYIDLQEYINENIIELNYIVKKSELFWPTDSKKEWTDYPKFKLTNL